ncbi:hypothetical protein NUU61_006968 [Penicillium alfredii]|uniref:Uncharacterized protein n=1 Tax=Penicillium alfredii TaxID=1506179 RepID=A0A9W9K3T9_9EURO|nr:uncharacterized protein NUU61_006968 [Penicillium alfredii]KAJ5092098.1 hypothetical protein NUU61_006968 [Penicillium alfredii]
MLALRDQENLVNTHQTAAAGKPLNQGLKQLAPKTPGKTPFKVPLNDENNPLAFGKRTVKGNGKPGKDAFMTPMEPKNRAPLGMKTTNAKAKGLQTPAPLGTLKPEKTNRRTSTAQKIKKAAPVLQQAQPKVHNEPIQEEVPDIEYMPPKPTDLPDIPDDVTYDTSFPQFRPKNRALGLESVYGRQEVGSDGLTQKQRKFQQDSATCDRMVDELIMKQLDSVGFDEQSDNESVEAPTLQPQPQPRAKGPTVHTRSTRNIPTLRSREAASALAAPKPSAAPTRTASAPKPRVTSSLLMPKKKARVPTNPSSMRNTAAAANANTTVGYSKGRTVSCTLREETQKSSRPQPTLSPETYMQLYGPPPLGSDMWSRCKAAGCFDEAESAAPLELGEPLQTFGEDEETEDFQLTL